MVKVAPGSHAKINKKVTRAMINEIFGRTLTHRRTTRTLDNFGQISSISNSDTTFTGDLQVYPNVDERLVDIGMIDVGDGVLYIHPDELSTRPETEDFIVDGSAVWEIEQELEAPTLNGSVCHYSYKLKRRVNSSDT